MIENQKVGNAYRSGVGTTTTITFKDAKGAPVSGVDVKESPVTKDNLADKTLKNVSNPAPARTDSQGQIGDVVMATMASTKESKPLSPEESAAMKDGATSTPYSRTTDQTLTFTTGGQICTCTYSQTLSNADANGNLNKQTNSQGVNFTLTTTTPTVTNASNQQQKQGP